VALVIRDADPEELGAMAELVISAYEEFMSQVSGDFAAAFRDSLNGIFLDDETEVLVAERAEQVVGTVTLFGGGASYGGHTLPPDWAAMRLLAVLPGSRRQGVGRALTQECIRRSRDRHLSTILLHTLPFMTGARAMYEGLSFRRAPELDANLTPEVSVLAYRLDL
jgi:ribosomal protein S18 acetylase RimI-like enzyme